MGTIYNWIEAAISGGFFGIMMALMMGPRKAPDGIITSWSWADGASYALLGLSFGIWTTFRWRALHPPLVFMLLLAICGAFAVSKLAPLKPPPIDKSPYRQ